MKADTETLRIQRERRAKAWWFTFATFSAVFVICAVIIIVASIRDPNGEGLIESPGAVLIGFFSLVATVGSGVIAKLSPLQPAIEVIKENVQNDHVKPDGTPLIMRDDLDDKHEELLAALSQLQREYRQDIAGIRQELREDRKSANDRFDGIDDRLLQVYRETKKL